MKLSDNKTPQVKLGKMHAFFLVGMSSDKANLDEVSVYGTLSANDEAANIFHIFRFISVMYKLQAHVVN